VAQVQNKRRVGSSFLSKAKVTVCVSIHFSQKSSVLGLFAPKFSLRLIDEVCCAGVEDVKEGATKEDEDERDGEDFEGSDDTLLPKESFKLKPPIPIFTVWDPGFGSVGADKADRVGGFLMGAVFACG